MLHIKTEKEIDILRQCAELVSRTLATVARYIRPGVTTAELDAIAEDFIRTQGAEPAFKGYRVGRQVYPATLCVSVNDQVVHGIPGDYQLQEGDVVSVDCGVRYRGFYGDSAYTFGVGLLDPENVRLCRVTYEALEKGVAQAVAGKRIGDISHAIQQHCEAAGYGVVRALVGHGIGRRLHEEPQVPNVGRAGTGRRLRVGMTLCVEPMVNRGTYEVRLAEDGWTVHTADGQPSAHYEHMIVVRAGQPEVLTTFAYIEEVVEAPYKQTASPHGEAETHYAGR